MFTGGTIWVLTHGHVSSNWLVIGYRAPLPWSLLFGVGSWFFVCGFYRANHKENHFIFDILGGPLKTDTPNVGQSASLPNIRVRSLAPLGCHQ